MIVVGDSKQLPPTSFFKRKLDEEELGEVEVEETESILDECVAAHIPTTMLTWHYRSRRESLIAFSNRRYYDGKLQTFPAPKDDALGVRFRYVADGLYEKGGAKTNKPEAKALVNAVVARLRSPSFKGKSLGVVTFNEAQKHLIEDLLDDARRKYPEIEPFFDESALEPVFVKNLENVQGDERDIIYFSICYGPDAKGAISMNFGPLNVEGRERRLNVAITRAKEENVVFSSIRSADISLSRTQKKGPSDLKAFLEYAESGGGILAETPINEGVRLEDNFEFEREIAGFLRSKGYEVDERVGTSRRRVDLAVVSTNEQTGEREYVAAIECDGATYASAETARDRDILRAQVLENLGWRTIRVWSTAWTHEREKTETKLLRELEAAFVEFANERNKRDEEKASANDERVDDYDLELDLELDDDSNDWATPRDTLSTLDSDGERVFWNADQDPRTYRYYRVPTADSNSREFGDVPEVELTNALKAALDESKGPFDEDRIFRNALNKLGFQRLTQQIKTRLCAALRQAATDR